MLQTEKDSKCRPFQRFDETIEHVILTCSVSSEVHCTERHDRLCAQLYFNTCKEIGVILDNQHRYHHVPIIVETSREGKVTIL